MKTFFLIFITLFLGCTNANEPSSAVNKKPVVQNTDTLKRIDADTKRHFDLVKQVFGALHLDSLNSNDGEAYRFIMLKGMTSGEIGNPISISFHKKTDSTYVRIDEILELKGNLLNKKMHLIPLLSFDSISNMFTQYFWDHEITDKNCTELIVNGSTKFYESFKDGKHKIISQSNCPDKNLLPNAYFNFFIFSDYDKVIKEDFIWFKNNPPGNIKTPGPPSSLKHK